MTAKKKVSKPASSTAPSEPKKAAAPRRRSTKAPVFAEESVPATSAVLAEPASAVSDDDVRVRAYFLALESGGNGSSFDYWLRAEQELRGSGASRD